MIGWHVFALLLPFIVLGLVAEWLRLREGSVFLRAWRLLRSRHVALGAVALTAGGVMLALNFGRAVPLIGADANRLSSALLGPAFLEQSVLREPLMP